NEFESGENSPSRVLMERVLSTAYLWHGYGRSTIGSRSDIEHVPIDRLQAFYRKYYQPDNAMLVVAGKFEEAKTVVWLKEFFSSMIRAWRCSPRLWRKPDRSRMSRRPCSAWSTESSRSRPRKKRLIVRERAC